MPEESKFRHLKFKKGAVILEEGKTGEDVYLIKSGKVEIRKGIRHDNPLILGVRNAGGIIGEMAMFDGGPHMAAAIALEDTVVTAMSRPEFQRRLDSLEPIVKGTVKVIIERAREMAEMLAQKPGPANWRDWKKK